MDIFHLFKVGARNRTNGSASRNLSSFHNAGIFRNMDIPKIIAKKNQDASDVQENIIENSTVN